jgi:hypothetical protein
MSCTVDLSTLRASPFSLVDGELIVARVSATNVIGTSASSSENVSGVNMAQAPTSSLVLTRDASSTSTLLVINWSALSSPANGGSSITSYKIYEWNGQAYVLYYTEADPAILQYTVDHTVTAG